MPSRGSNRGRSRGRSGSQSRRGGKSPTPRSFLSGGSTIGMQSRGGPENYWSKVHLFHCLKIESKKNEKKAIEKSTNAHFTQ